MDHRELIWARSIRQSVAKKIDKLEAGAREVQRWAGGEIDITESTLATLRGRLEHVDKMLAASGREP